jgi:hypothetical protein
VHGVLGRAAEGLADAVAGQKQALTTRGAEIMELLLLDVRLVEEKAPPLFSEPFKSVLRNPAGIEVY